MAIACIGTGLTLLAIGLGLLPRRLHAEDAKEKKPVAGEFASEKLIVGKETREYRLFVPKSIDLTKPAPLVIAFHGMLIDSKDLMPRYVSDCLYLGRPYRILKTVRGLVREFFA